MPRLVCLSAAFPTIPPDTPPYVRLGRLMGFLQNQVLYGFPAVPSRAQLERFTAVASEALQLHRTHGWMRAYP